MDKKITPEQLETMLRHIGETVAKPEFTENLRHRILIERPVLRHAFTKARSRTLNKEKYKNRKTHALVQEALKEFCNLVWGYLDTQEKP